MQVSQSARDGGVQREQDHVRSAVSNTELHTKYKVAMQHKHIIVHLHTYS